MDFEMLWVHKHCTRRGFPYEDIFKFRFSHPYSTLGLSMTDSPSESKPQDAPLPQAEWVAVELYKATWMELY